MKMPVIKLTVNRTNPPFSIADMKAIMPAFKKYLDTAGGIANFEIYNEIANEKVFKSVWGAEWKIGMANCIAHYMVLAAQDAKAAQAGSGDTLAGIASMGMGGGMLTSWSVGEVSKTYDFSKITLEGSSDAAFWNLTKFGIRFYALWKQKQPFTMGVVI